MYKGSPNRCIEDVIETSLDGRNLKKNSPGCLNELVNGRNNCTSSDFIGKGVPFSIKSLEAEAISYYMKFRQTGTHCVKTWFQTVFNVTNILGQLRQDC